MIKDYDDHEGNPIESLNMWLDDGVPLRTVVLWAVILTVMALLAIFWPETAHSAGIHADRAINAIIGESEGEPFRGKLAVACAIRNRGTLKGVYGERAPRVLSKKYSASILKDATLAWDKSGNKDACSFIGGASFWEGMAFPAPSWAKNMTVTATIGRQRFYKERK